ncbi:MAG: hypothetical protein HYX42_04075 [Polaromonas sp.]|uniref:hypothetical protein n=1 Tax=Polaromonas sp. TaxID=1869339 RepID=UPI0025D7DE0E|nr:hypothetical protein [Polaromonas sp.]MBI2725408.1 hypothetical protein [Polaromonas sp.]
MSIKKVRETLKAAPDGLTVAAITKVLHLGHANINTSLKKMPDVYIDRYIKAKAGPYKYAAVYMAVEVPENAPMPD